MGEENDNSDTTIQRHQHDRSGTTRERIAFAGTGKGLRSRYEFCFSCRSSSSFVDYLVGGRHCLRLELNLDLISTSSSDKAAKQSRRSNEIWNGSTRMSKWISQHERDATLVNVTFWVPLIKDTRRRRRREGGRRGINVAHAESNYTLLLLSPEKRRSG